MVIVMQGLCEERPQGWDQATIAEALARKHDYVTASNIFAGLNLSGLNAQQLLRVGEIHFRAGLAAKSRICFRDAVTVFNHARKIEGESAGVCCWLARAYGYLALYSWIPNKIRFAIISRRYAKKTLVIDPRHALSAFVLAIWHQNMPAWLGGDHSMVGDYLNQAVQNNGNSIMFRIARVRWNIKQNKLAEAYTDLIVINQLFAIDPEDVRRKIEALALLESYFPTKHTEGSYKTQTNNENGGVQ